MSTKLGYARVSSTDQTLDVQIAALEAAGCERQYIYSERLSGNSTKQRIELQRLLDYLRPGDQVVITRIDRLARSMRDLLNIVEEIHEKGAELVVIEQSIDSKNITGRAMLGMLAVFAEMETNLRKERQREGIEAAKAKGNVYQGKVAKKNTPEQLEKLRQLILAGHKEGALMKELGIARSTLYAMKKTLKQEESA